MKIRHVPLLLCLVVAPAFANTAPTPVIVSAAMRSGTTYLDVVFRVNDPDSTTVQVRALAFINGTRSFANVIRPTTFVGDTSAVLGNAVPANTDRTLTWDVAADWNVDLGQLKFEILALDERGLLAFDWITVPAVGAQPALTISKDTPASAKVLDALFWEYAGSNPWVTLESGALKGTTQSGVFSGITLASGSTPLAYAPLFCFKRMNLDPASAAEITYAAVTARAGLLATGSWHAVNRAYVGVPVVFAWGYNNYGQIDPPGGLSGVTQVVAAGYFSLALKNDGTVTGWGYNYSGQLNVPAGLSGVIAIAAGQGSGFALKSDGTVIGWGDNSYGQLTIPVGLTGVTAIAGGAFSGTYVLALKNDGTLVGWGYNTVARSAIPAGLSGAIAVSAGENHALALKSDGTVVAWGNNTSGQTAVPAGLSGVIAISAGQNHSLALKSDGTVVAWGSNNYGQSTVPAGLSSVTAIAAGGLHNLALKSDGTVVAWGYNANGQGVVPTSVRGVVKIAASSMHNVVLKSEVP